MKSVGAIAPLRRAPTPQRTPHVPEAASAVHQPEHRAAETARPQVTQATDRSAACRASCHTRTPQSPRYPQMRRRPESRDMTTPAHRAPPFERTDSVPQVPGQVVKIRHDFDIFSPLIARTSEKTCAIQRYNRTATVANIAHFSRFRPGFGALGETPGWGRGQNKSPARGHGAIVQATKRAAPRPAPPKRVGDRT